MIVFEHDACITIHLDYHSLYVDMSDIFVLCLIVCRMTTFLCVIACCLSVWVAHLFPYLQPSGFDEVQTLEMEDFCQDFVVMSFDQHGSTVVLDMIRSMSYLPGMGLGQHQHRPSEFMAIPDHDVPFGLGFIPTEADYRYMTRLCKERVRA